MMPYSLVAAAGRGYSDLCAAMCAVGVGAKELQVWKEVDGVFTADPREVSSARLLATITLEEAAELTFFGSEVCTVNRKRCVSLLTQEHEQVIHPLTMGQIRRGGIPMRIKNVVNPAGNGTIILPGEAFPGESEDLPDRRGSPASVLKTANFMAANGYHGGEQERRTPTAVTSKSHIMVVSLSCHRNSKSSAFLTTIFHQLERYDVAVDLVAVSEACISVAVDSSKYIEPIRELAAEMEEAGKVSTDVPFVCEFLTGPAGPCLHLQRHVHHFRDWPQDEEHGGCSGGSVRCLGCCEDQHPHDQPRSE